MSFSPEWERQFSTGGSHSRWPWSDLVSEVMRRAKTVPGRLRVLELGPAVGSNVPLFLELDADYYAIEGSATALRTLIERFPSLEGRVSHGDFTKSFPFSQRFDMVIDRSALTHNTDAAIRAALAQVRASLRQGGWFIGIDWFSTRHSAMPSGTPAEDEWTRTAFPSGRFEGVGRVHFSDEAHLRDLFGNFEIEVLDEKSVVRHAQSGERWVTWNIVARAT